MINLSSHLMGRRFDGFVKSPSAALRRKPQFLRALNCLGERRSPKQGRPAGRPYDRNHHSEKMPKIETKKT
jgi:hypothetical protein